MFAVMLGLILSTASETDRAAVYLNGNSAHVSYADLNLRSGEGRQRLVGRIHRAAHLLCEAPDPAPLLPDPSHAECLRVAMSDGVAQMNMIARH